MDGEYKTLNDISLERQCFVFWQRKLFTQLFF